MHYKNLPKIYWRCAYIAALLLFLDEHVKTSGYCMTLPSTSNPCEWNKGKKREKNPKLLHKASYMSVKRSQSSLYKFYPRPVNFRGASQQLLNDFVVDQQSYGAKYKESPMWLSLMRIKYDNFEIKDDHKSYLFEDRANLQ